MTTAPSPASARSGAADITARDLAGQIYRFAVEACPEGMVIFDGNGRMVMVNTAIERLFGYRREELIVQPVEMLMPHRLRADQKRRREVFNLNPDPARNSSGPGLFGMRKDASEFPIETAFTLIETSDGPLVLCMIVDMTERKRAQLRLDEMENKYRGLLEAAPDAIVVVDESGAIVLLNVQAEQQFGYRREELLGQPVRNILPEGFPQPPSSDFATHRSKSAHDSDASIELQGQRKDGSTFPVEITLSPLTTTEGTQVTAAIRNTSVRKQMDHLKDEFVATVSHELRTPLTSISGSLGLLVGQWSHELPPSAAGLLTIAHNNSQRLVRLINDILDIEKIEAGRVAFNFARVDVRTLVEQVIEDSRGFAQGYGVSIHVDPASAGEVNADPDRLAQIVTNLLSNAVKFSPPDGEVTVLVENTGEAVRISVRDRGPGVPADFRPHIFDKFAQADATDSRQKGGTGLGLSIVKQITERLGGEVGFDDAPGGGTVFFVELPAWDGRRPRVLHVDDDHNILALVKAVLGASADVVSVDSLESARLALKSDEIDLAVLDISLDVGSGLDLLPELRDARGQAIPVIVFSAREALTICDQQVQSALAKSKTSIEALVATIHDRLPNAAGSLPRRAA